jgi:hypothetical protein
VNVLSETLSAREIRAGSALLSRKASTTRSYAGASVFVVTTKRLMHVVIRLPPDTEGAR